MERVFNAGTLMDLRKEVLAEASAAGLSDERANDVMLTMHELAANAVRHGGGGGLAQLQVIAGELHCLVSDAGARSAHGSAARRGATRGSRWQFRRGHGLWLVRAAADRVSVVSSPSGSEVTAVFALPDFFHSVMDDCWA